MRRPFVTMTALALALLPVAAFAQTPPPAQQPPAAAPPTPPQPAAPKLTFKSPPACCSCGKAGPDGRVRGDDCEDEGGAAASTDASLKAGANVKMYKSADRAPAATRSTCCCTFGRSRNRVFLARHLQQDVDRGTEARSRDAGNVQACAAAIVGMNILNLAEVEVKQGAGVLGWVPVHQALAPSTLTLPELQVQSGVKPLRPIVPWRSLQRKNPVIQSQA